MKAPGSTNRRDHTLEGRDNPGILKQRLGPLEFGLRDFPLTPQVVHRLWDDKVWRFGARLDHSFVVGAAYGGLGLVLRFVGQQLGHLYLRQ
jgi:hypothetical protein